MDTITFECKTITPMFLSGADGMTPELRAPSIKGAMRFWWRACNGGLPFLELKEMEDELFGCTENKSKFSIIVESKDFEPSFDDFNQSFQTYVGNSRKRNGFHTNAMYYLGYGVANWVPDLGKAQFIRPYIPVGSEFLVTLRAEKSYIKNLVAAFKILEQYGGIGSKSRNGFGSFEITKCILNNREIKLPNIMVEDKDKAKPQIGSYTAFSTNMKVFETRNKKFPSWELAFKELSMAYQYARENIEKWHHWDKRELIAMPIVVKGGRNIKDNFLDRHTKPYFMHIGKSGAHYFGRIVELPYEYLEDYPEMSLNETNEKRQAYFEALNRFNSLLMKKLDVIK